MLGLIVEDATTDAEAGTGRPGAVSNSCSLNKVPQLPSIIYILFCCAPVLESLVLTENSWCKCDRSYNLPQM